MAVSTTTAASINPQTVGHAFVEQYYFILHAKPDLCHRFYLDSSIVSRPDANGVMTSVTTVQGINDLVMSLDSKRYSVKIETADTQASYKDGVLILVTGCLKGEDNFRRRFTQSFFLAPQDKGAFFVLNDVFRFVDEDQSDKLLGNGSTEDSASPVPQSDGLVEDQHKYDSGSPLAEASLENGVEAANPSENGGTLVDEEVVFEQPGQTTQADAPLDSEPPTVTQEDLPKKSYASILKVAKGSSSLVPVYVPTTKPKPPAAKHEQPSVTTATPAPAPETQPAKGNIIVESNGSEDVGGYSIYVWNLPLNATAQQVDEEFQKFGAIKPGGVQVRSHKVEPFCFGFVEFEALESMQAAIEASPIKVGGRPAYVEEKRTATRVVNGVVVNGNGGNRGRFPNGRGGFRNDNYKVRGFNSNQGYARGEFRNRNEFSNRGRGSAGHDGYQPRNVLNGNARMASHSNGHKQIAISA